MIDTNDTPKPPTATIDIITRDCDLFPHAAEYTLAINYQIDDSGEIAINTAECIPAGNQVPFVIGSTLHAELARRHGRALREHYQAAHGPAARSPAMRAAMAWILRAEGGYSADPDDPGGVTKYGISKRQYPLLDINKLTIEAALEIYRRDYWVAYRLDELPEPAALVTFDGLVNHAPADAIRILQRSIGARADGIIGPRTIDMTNRADQHQLILDMAARRLKLYAEIIERRPTSEKFRDGWNRRVINLLGYTLPRYFSEGSSNE